MNHLNVLDKIKREFGSREEVIERAYISCPSFRTLCGDYLACLRTLARCRQSGSEDACRRQTEYSELLQGLATEIEDRLYAVGSVRVDSAAGWHPGAGHEEGE